jgi:hypothetical protein
MKIQIADWQQLFQNCVRNSPLPISLPTIALANPPYCKINLTSDSELARFEMAYKWIKHGDGSFTQSLWQLRIKLVLIVEAVVCFVQVKMGNKPKKLIVIYL